MRRLQVFRTDILPKLACVAGVNGEGVGGENASPLLASVLCLPLPLPLPFLTPATQANRNNPLGAPASWKIERYQDLAFEVRRMHRVEVIVVPLVIGALGTVPKEFARWQEYLGISDIVGRAQMSLKHISLKRCYIFELWEGAEIFFFFLAEI